MRLLIATLTHTVGETRILRQYLFGAVVSGCNIAIHAAVMVTVIGVARRVGEMTLSHQALRLIAVMITAVLILMVAHFAEVLVWAVGYAIVGVAPEGAELVYFAFVNYTTLGYGDVTPTERWHLLGPMTAMNVVLVKGVQLLALYVIIAAVLYLIPAAAP